MAHEVAVNVMTQNGAMFSVLQTPWHGEGVVLNQAPTILEAMDLMDVAGEVQVRPLYVADDAGFQVSHTGQMVVRVERDGSLTILGPVGDYYQPLQDVDAFGVLEPLLDSGVASLETGGKLRNGADTWMLVRFNIADPVVQEAFGSEVIPFGLISNNHTGRRNALVLATPVRVVCANTLGQAMVGWEDRADVVAVKHTGDAKVRMVDAAEKVFATLVDRYRTIAQQYQAMRVRILTVEEFTKTVLDQAAPLPADLHSYGTEHLTVRGYDLARARAEERRNAITAAWTGGRGHKGDGSAWEAYNGAVQVIDHDSKLYRTNGSRVAALMGGRLLERKQAVLNAVAQLAGVERN